ncbi:MAG: sigma-70 family RNA polymerase sigma factor [Anaerolineales bacterium]|nr:sigma-70 family RNA polymerase sigma factor [Anaerolineales bacterium]
MQTNNEVELVNQILLKDQQAYTEFIHRYQAVVFNVAWRMLGIREDAEDAAQDTFLRAFRFIKNFDRTRPIVPWLKQIAVNVCFDRLKRIPEEQPLEEDTLPYPDPAPGPETQASQRLRRERIHLEILKLPPRYRAVIELRHFQELRYHEIARVLNRPLSDIKSDLFRARKLLAAALQELNTGKSV